MRDGVCGLNVSGVAVEARIQITHRDVLTTTDQCLKRPLEQQSLSMDETSFLVL